MSYAAATVIWCNTTLKSDNSYKTAPECESFFPRKSEGTHLETICYHKQKYAAQFRIIAGNLADQTPRPQLGSGVNHVANEWS